MSEYEEQLRITRLGNPSKPQGDEGKLMLERMNESHFEVTGWALDFWKIKGDDEILDIGCGGGKTLNRMATKVDTGHLYGIDISEVSCAVSSEVNREEIAKNKMKIEQGTVEKLPYPENSFDKIITVESFYFWPDPKENLKEVFRVLKENGTFALVADIYGKEDLDEQVKNNIKEFNLFNPTPKEFSELLKEAGFVNVEIHLQEENGWICAIGRK